MKLRLELINLHLLIDLHVTISSPHAPVEHFVEIDVPVVRLDRHLEDLLLEFAVVDLLFWEAKSFVFGAKEAEETGELLLSDLLAAVPLLGQLFPNFHEAYLIFFEPV